MPATVTATITYTGTILAAQVNTSPWSCCGIVFPGRGGAALSPQMATELLQPANVDGSRMRAGGAHYPAFKMLTIIGVDTYDNALLLARQLELCKSDTIGIEFRNVSTILNCLDVKALAVAKPIVGGVALVSGTESAAASVEAEWDVQVKTL